MSRFEQFLEILPKLRSIAKQNGYALGLHGSLERDFDLIAVPWTDEAIPPDDLAEAIKEAAGCVRWRVFRGSNYGETILKPHGRLVYCFDWDKNNHENKDYIDLSVAPLPSEQLTALQSKLSKAEAEVERGCCLGCNSWAATQQGQGRCLVLGVYTDESFYCASVTPIS